MICILSLYFFICSLDLLASAGRLITGKSASSFINESSILTNPIVGKIDNRFFKNSLFVQYGEANLSLAQKYAFNKKSTIFKGHFTKEALYQGGWTQKFVWVIYWGRNAQIQKIRVF